MRNTKLLATPALILALTACNMAPKYVRPELPVPETTAAAGLAGPGEGAAGTVMTVSAETAWHDFFVDPRLTRVL